MTAQELTSAESEKVALSGIHDADVLRDWGIGEDPLEQKRRERAQEALDELRGEVDLDY